MRKLEYFSLILLLLIFNFSFLTCCADSNNYINEKNVSILEEMKSERYDYYEYNINDNNMLIEAIESCNGFKLANLGYEYDENVNISYSLNYDFDAEAIFITVTVSSNYEIINVENITAYPFIYNEGESDAYIYLADNSTIYLSEIYNDNVVNCFALTLSLSLATLISTMITVAKVATVITAVVVIAGTTIQVAQMTKAKLDERTRAAAAEKKKKNPQYYYPATRKNGKLLISSTPQGLVTASKQILTGVDYWSPYAYTAKDLAVKASSGYIGPEVDSKSNGKYYHYHLLGRIGGHSFFGSPVGGTY